ncbi:alkaline phosphatase family protein [Desulfovermiculus halophilus]|uniref:alkaline phosphatase family protein n=1 Tax=Desulfovermiculus halophilus TaxID=339722 RepID=UPI0004873979|nr:alkaline phosphatase family protein [Desulfovermiculus halophilus]
MSPSKCLFIILDGLGDRQYPELEDQTPLQAAHTPNLDRLARLGGNGLYHPGRLGEPFPSESAHFALFGYPQALFPGRGPLEAIGAGIELAEGEVAVLTHFVSAEKRDGVLFVRWDRPQEVDEHEIQAVFDQAAAGFEHRGVEISLHRTRGLFGVLVLRGEVSPRITDSNPMRDMAPASDVVPWSEAGSNVQAEATAEALRTYLRRTFHALECCEVQISRRQRGLAPINALVTQRAGRMRAVPSFPSRTGLKGASIASGAMFGGLAGLVGLDAHDVQKVRDVQADFAARLRLAGELLPRYDFIHVHTKAPDQAAHSKDCRAKREVIEALDRALAAHMPMLAQDPNILTVIASDHSTPSSGPMIHSGEPVPVIMRGETIRRDQVQAFDEICAAGGCLGLMRDTELFQTVLNGLNKAKLQGIRESAEERLFWPGPASDLLLDEGDW